MKVFGWPKRFNGRALAVENFHRAGLGLETDTKAFLAAIPSRSVKDPYPKLLLSTLPPEKWSNLWRLSAVLQERKGVVFDLLGALREAANIEVLETLTTDTEHSHEVFAIVSLLAGARGEGEVNSTTLDQAVRKALDALAIEPSTVLKDELRLSPLSRLQDAARLRTAAGLSRFIPDVITRGRFPLPKGDFDAMLTEAGADLRRSGRPDRVILYSDTEEKYLSCHFPPSDQTLLHVSLEHKDEPGAIASLSKAVAAARANIINSYSRLRSAGTTAEWRAILDVGDVSDCARIIESLANLDLFVEVSDVKSFPPTNVRGGRSPVLRDSIFSHSSPVGRDKNFVGRTDLVGSIIKEVPSVNFLLRGFSKSGKSCILDDVLSRVEESRPELVALSATASGDHHDIWSNIVSSLASSVGALGFETQSQEMISALESISRVGETLGARAESWDVSRSYLPGVERAFRELSGIVGCVRPGSEVKVERILILLDEAQNLLASGSKFRSINGVWLTVVNQMQGIRWVVATTGTQADGGGNPELIGKFRSITVGSLNPSDSIDLLRMSFRVSKVYPYPRAVRSMLLVTGCVPVYLQALGLHIVQRFKGRPRQLNIVGERDVREAIEPSVIDLEEHFKALYEVLCEMLGEDVVRSRLLGQGSSLSLYSEFDVGSGARLRYLPGVMVDRNSDRYQDGFSVSAVGLFRAWASIHGVIPHSLRDIGTTLFSAPKNLSYEVERAIETDRKTRPVLQ